MNKRLPRGQKLGGLISQGRDRTRKTKCLNEGPQVYVSIQLHAFMYILNVSKYVNVRT